MNDFLPHRVCSLYSLSHTHPSTFFAGSCLIPNEVLNLTRYPLFPLKFGIERNLRVETGTAPNEKGTIAPDLLGILCCPETKQEVSLLAPEVVNRLNQRIANGELNTKGGQSVKEKIDGGLLRKDGTIVYPIRDQIPVMLIEEGILIAESEIAPT